MSSFTIMDEDTRDIDTIGFGYPFAVLSRGNEVYICYTIMHTEMIHFTVIGVFIFISILRSVFKYARVRFAKAKG